MSEIKPCPFCGKFTQQPHDGPYARCPECWTCGGSLRLYRWQERPIEDALRSTLAAAERERDEARATVKRYEDAFPAGQLIYDALRKDRDDWQRKAERLETLMAHIGTGAGMACRMAMNGRLPQEGQE